MCAVCVCGGVRNLQCHVNVHGHVCTCMYMFIAIYMYMYIVCVISHDRFCS